MAGSHPAFDPANFRTQIRAAMTMGLPTASSERATFKWSIDRTFAVETAASGVPFDLGAVPVTVDAPADVQVACAVEALSSSGDSKDTPVGSFDLTKIRLTLLDEDYALIFSGTRRADMVQLDDAIFDIDYVAPPLGLFEVTVFQVYATARDEA